MVTTEDYFGGLVCGVGREKEALKGRGGGEKGGNGINGGWGRIKDITLCQKILFS